MISLKKEGYILPKKELDRVRLDKRLPFTIDQMEEPTLAAGRFIDSFGSSVHYEILGPSYYPHMNFGIQIFIL